MTIVLAFRIPKTGGTINVNETISNPQGIEVSGHGVVIIPVCCKVSIKEYAKSEITPKLKEIMNKRWNVGLSFNAMRRTVH